MADNDTLPLENNRAWPADKVERRPVKDLVPYARNARTHSKEQIGQIARSMQEFGFTNPVLIDESGGIIAGHGRVLAAKQLGYPDVPVMVAAGWTEAQRRAYVIADNKLALNAGWDEDLLRAEFGDLGAMDFDLGLTGFSFGEIESLNSPSGSGGHASVGKLAERFGVVPFSVLNAREGWWQDRKAAWLALGIESEIGRGENLLKFSDTINEPDPAKRAAKKASAVPGNHGRASSPSHRDPSFYAGKRAWEAANGRKISTEDFRLNHWDGRPDAA